MDITALQTTILFRGMQDTEIGESLSALGAKEKTYKKGETLLHAGTTAPRMGLVRTGSVTVESNDMWGNRTILGNIGPGQVFAETYALLRTEPLLVDVTANEDCRVLFLCMDKLSQVRAAWSGRFLTNLLTISAHKNLHLSGRSFHTSPKTIRGRVFSYLNAFSLKTGKREFDIPFDRQQLADYLNVERTALSKELGKMQADGYFTVRKNHFVLLKNELQNT